jgi:Flp pilus assembly protein TadD
MHRKCPVRLLFALLLALQAPRCLLAQQGWSISGSVMTYHGETPDRPILVTLQFRGSAIATTFSDSEGKFSFSELSPNVYHLLVDDDKYRPVDQMVEVNPMVTSPTIARLSLVPKESARPENPPLGSNPHMVGSLELKQFPRPALKEFDKGIKAEKDGRIEDAISHYQKAIKVAPDLYPARNNLGSAYLGKSQFAAAREQFESVVKVNPSDATAYFNMGNLLLLTQKYPEATRWLGEGLSKEPNSSFGHFLLGSVCTRLGKNDQAEKELRTSLQLDSKMSKAHLALVNLFLQQQRLADAADELRRFLKDVPEDPLAPKVREVLKKLEARLAAPHRPE